MKSIPFDPATLYYVIIGCGFSAITNHATLAATGSNFDGHTVLHIGDADPWSGYGAKPMGQWPALLGLPSYQNLPTNPTSSTYLRADEFAASNADEWDRLFLARPFSHLPGRVTAIQAIGNPSSEYRITVKGEFTQVVRASHIDVCGGPGPARDLPTSYYIAPKLVTEYNAGSHPSSSWPRIMSGEQFLSNTSASPFAQRVCVVGGGPTAAWCVEQAQASGSEVLWISPESINPAFLSSRRNDHLVAGIIRRPLEHGERVVKGPLLPSAVTTFFAEGFAPHDIDELANGEVRVQFAPVVWPKYRYVGRSGRIAPPPYRDFDRVVFSIGQACKYGENGSWADLLKPVLQTAIAKKTHVLKDRNHRAVGLHSDDRRVRVLGAAALSHPDLAPHWSTPGTRSNLFLRSLTEQAQVRVGITLAAVTIAEANRFWNTSTRTNENLNTASLGDLIALLIGLDPALTAPQTWFECRGARIPPLTHGEFGSLMKRRFYY